MDQDRPAVSGMLSNLGVLYMDLGELQKGKEFRQKALLCRRKVLGINHPAVGDCVLNLGLVLEPVSNLPAC